MRREELKAILSRAKFRPFDLTLESGERYEVRHPESIHLLTHNVVMDTPEEVTVIFEIADVTSVRFVARNGRRK